MTGNPNNPTAFNIGHARWHRRPAGVAWWYRRPAGVRGRPRQTSPGYWSRLLRAPALFGILALVLLSAQPADAQENRRPPRGGGDVGVIPRVPPGIPIRPRPDDFGPLRPGEEQRILAFTQRHMPEGHRRMRALLNRDPEAFRSRIAPHLPRLRRLMAIFDADPELGRAFVRHMDNMLAVRRARDQLRQGRGQNPPRHMVEQLIRRHMADNIQIEMAALDRLLQSGRKSRDTDAKRLANWLASPQADVTAEPPELRDAVETFRNAETPQRDGHRAKLNELAEKRIDSELEDIEKRLDRLRRIADRELDRRVARAMDLSDRAGNDVMAIPSTRPKP